MGFNQMVTSLLLVGLFAFAIVSLTINFGNDNSAAVKLSSDSDFNTYSTDIEGNINSFITSGNSSSSDFAATTIEPGDDTSATGGQFKTMTSSAPKGAITAMKLAYKRLLGTDTGFGIFLTSISAWIVFILGTLGWKAWRGNPD